MKRPDAQEEVIAILMRRDGMSRPEAEYELDYLREMAEEDPYQIDDLLEDCLGLEPDYIFALL